MSDRFHPRDSYSQAAATGTNTARLIANFEDALASFHRGADFQVGALEVIASVAIARVQLLERDLEERDLRLAGLFDRTDNVVSLNRFKPGGSVA